MQKKNFYTSIIVMKCLVFILLALIQSIPTKSVDVELEPNGDITHHNEDIVAHDKLHLDTIETDAEKELVSPYTNQVSTELAELVNRMKKANPKVEAQALVDMAALIESALNDDETPQIASNIRNNQEIIDLQEKLTEEMAVFSMLQQMNKMYELQVLFQNPAQAFVDLRMHGKISKEDIEEFNGNPKGYGDKYQLKAWFEFIKVATAGGYF